MQPLASLLSLFASDARLRVLNSLAAGPVRRCVLERMIGEEAGEAVESLRRAGGVRIVDDAPCGCSQFRLTAPEDMSPDLYDVVSALLPLVEGEPSAKLDRRHMQNADLACSRDPQRAAG